MTPQQLRSSILQLAIQGKLVEQRPEEGTGAELLEKILAAKNAKEYLTRSRGVRGEKNTSALSAPPREEISDPPFEIPESWVWVHINQIADTSLGKTMDKAKNTGDVCQYLCSINVYWEGILLEKVKEALFSAEDKKKYLLKKGDLLICEGGDVGRSAIWNSDKEMYYQNALHRVRFYSDTLPQYFKIIIECYKGLGIIERYCKGVTIKHLVQNSLYAMWFPLPPLAEQKRIVAKIEELLPYVERYEKAWGRLEEFNRRFPEDMRKSVLQMAIQGKLVEQRPEEGTGAELLREILAAKGGTRFRASALMTGGTGATSGTGASPSRPARRNARPAGPASPAGPTPVSPEEQPFEIPESWAWVRLGDIIDVRDGTHDTPKYVSEGVPLVTSRNLINGTIDFDTAKLISYADSEAINIRSGVDDGDIVFAMIGTIGNPVLIKKERNFSIKNMALFKPISRELFCMEYLLQFLTKAQTDMRKSASASVQSFVSLSFLRNYPIPLPPLAEQKRIVAKLEELLPLCERLGAKSGELSNS